MIIVINNRDIVLVIKYYVIVIGLIGFLKDFIILKLCGLVRLGN